MSCVPAYYSLIQISIRDEKANVGVVLFCPKLDTLIVRTHINLERLQSFFSESLNGVVENVSALVYRLNHSDFFSKSQLDTWIATRAGTVIPTPLRAIKLMSDIEKEANQLLEDLVK